jgi:hypothetical protein
MLSRLTPFQMLMNTLGLTLLLLYPIISLVQVNRAQAQTPKTQWWQSSSAYAMLPPTPTPPHQQRVYLQATPSTSAQTAVNFLSLPTVQTHPVIETPAVLPAIGAPQPWITLTSSDTLAKALIMMGESPEGLQSLAILHAKRGKVLFKNLEELSPLYRDFDALAWLDKHGNWMLFINEKHQNAPIPALSALIAHEAMHSDAHNSKQEEAQAWMREARTWLFFLKKYPELNENRLNAHPLVFRLNEIARYLQKNDLHRFVVEHPSYAKLPETSPMFSGGTFPVVTAKTTENAKYYDFLGLLTPPTRDAETPLKGIR